MEYALKLENVTKEYKDFKLENINITLPKGCIMGFIGENGAGNNCYKTDIRFNQP